MKLLRFLKCSCCVKFLKKIGLIKSEKKREIEISNTKKSTDEMTDNSYAAYYLCKSHLEELLQRNVKNDKIFLLYMMSISSNKKYLSVTKWINDTVNNDLSATKNIQRFLDFGGVIDVNTAITLYHTYNVKSIVQNLRKKGVVIQTNKMTLEDLCNYFMVNKNLHVFKKLNLPNYFYFYSIKQKF